MADVEAKRKRRWLGGRQPPISLFFEGDVTETVMEWWLGLLVIEERKGEGIRRCYPFGRRALSIYDAEVFLRGGWNGPLRQKVAALMEQNNSRGAFVDFNQVSEDEEGCLATYNKKRVIELVAVLFIGLVDNPLNDMNKTLHNEVCFGREESGDEKFWSVNVAEQGGLAMDFVVKEVGADLYTVGLRYRREGGVVAG